MQSTRNKLIEYLHAHSDTFSSGQKLADALNVSRNTIWKHIKELEKDGYVIDAQPRKGYQIKHVPEKMSENTLKWGLETDWLGKTIIHKTSIASTQNVAHELARDGAPHGTIVIADQQTGGKGRMNRSFHSNSDEGIWMSLLIRPQILPYLAPQLTLLTATVLAEAIETMFGIEAQIKWPNDVLIDRKKTAGILTEMQAEQDHIQYVVIGIGLNVSQKESEFHDDIRKKATSIAMHTNQTIDKQLLIQEILNIFESQYESFITSGFTEVKTKWEKYGFKIGEKISIKTMKNTWKATFVGISEDGALLTQVPGKEPERIYSAEIEWFT